jgi:Asp-tRNA(Asn)/Glu-tRNA(Gln) amidotransferase A subunit family amidase
VARNLRATAASFESAGAEVREPRCPFDLDLAIACHQVIQTVETAELHHRAWSAEPSAYAPHLRAIVEAGHLLPATAYLRAQRWRRRLRREIETLFESCDLLMLPTVSSVAPDPSTTGDTSFQGVWTLLGLPAISLPSGLSDGLPIGAQLVAPAWQEARLLAFGRWCEQVLDPLPPPLA